MSPRPAADPAVLPQEEPARPGKVPLNLFQTWFVYQVWELLQQEDPAVRPGKVLRTQCIHYQVVPRSAGKDPAGPVRFAIAHCLDPFSGDSRRFLI